MKAISPDAGPAATVSGRDRLTLTACAICPGVVLGVFTSFPVWVPVWMKQFGASRSAVMLIYSGSGILMTLTMPLVGRLVTRVPPWRLVALGAVLMGGGIIAASTLRNYYAFAAVYALAIGPGVTLAGILPCQSLTARLFPSRLGLVAGLMMVALAAVGVVLPVVLIRLQANAGWREAFAATGIGFLAVVLPLALTLLRQPQGRRAATAHAGPAHAAAAPRTGQILRSGSFWLIWAGMLPMVAAPTGIQVNFLPILADHGIGPGEASFVLSALAAGTAFGAAGFGWLADRTNPRLLLLIMAILMAGGAAALAGGGGVPIAFMAAAAIGLASGGAYPMSSVFSFRQFGAGYEPALGLMNSFMLPYILTPPLMGWLRDRTGNYSLALLALVPLLILGALGTWRLRPSRPAPVHAPAA